MLVVPHVEWILRGSVLSSVLSIASVRVIASVLQDIPAAISSTTAVSVSNVCENYLPS